MNNAQAIENALIQFSAGDLKTNALHFFKTLGYSSERGINKPINELLNDFNADNALFDDWLAAPFLFQLTEHELKIKASNEPFNNTIIESYLFTAIELKQNNYTRSELVKITRELNKNPQPVLILFKHGDSLTLSVIHRRLNKRDDSRDVLEKVTLLKDIAIENPHRAHLDILNDLSFDNLKPTPKHFVDLHNSWQKVLDTKELNKKFYKELSQWYFWASKQVTFPNPDNANTQQYHAQSLIRLLTRLLFVWFIKEKGLVPTELFEPSYINQQLISTHPSRYYRAILQNLFFATLNQTHRQRGFRHDKQQMNITNLMRYQPYFKDSAVFLKLVEAIVPFMNGGLFECLDKPTGKKGKQGGDIIAYMDGFSDRDDNIVNVPDFIFFGEQLADLSEELGNKYKAVKIKGLIDIFNNYKFTVAENTPLEEDIALDPELLGQVFENLLASYNEETKTTARKQTGSFYTPREIVDYMVDESLIAYFGGVQALLAGASRACTPEIADKLRELLSYNSSHNPFNEEQSLLLINAIDNCKILDPACGSGAFPMGVLHKLVHCLKKLDPDNKQWELTQRKKITHDTKYAVDNTQNNAELVEKLKALTDAFDITVNNPDYARKLFLIEQCIYGVDIQSIAIQISKLRCFIALIVEQKNDNNKPNFGVLALPNLETKFVAANTLIGIEKPKRQLSLFDDSDIEALENQLKEIRHRLFSAKTPKIKRELRDKDKKLREQIGELLEKQHDIDNATAQQLAQWNPYEQNASSGFFDSEWMFGFNGFDIVIGNPPYGFRKVLSNEEKLYFRKIQKIEFSTGDIAELFIIKSLKLFVKNDGVLAFIIPKKSLYGESWKNVRKSWLENSLISLLDTSKAFDNVLLEQVSFVLAKRTPPQLIKIGALNNNDNSIAIFGLFNVEQIYHHNNFQIYRGLYCANFLSKITLNSIYSSNVLNAHIGLSNITSHLTFEKTKYQCVKGIDICRYGIKKQVRFLKNEIAENCISKTQGDKIIFQEIIAHITKPVAHIKITGFFDTENRLFNDTCVEISISKNININKKFILAYFQSRFVNWYCYHLIYNKAIRTMHFINYYVAQIPIPKCIIDNELLQQPFIELVDKILASKACTPPLDTSALERDIDLLVYRLYDLTAEEINIIEGVT